MPLDDKQKIENWSTAFWELIINEAMASELDLNDKVQTNLIVQALEEVIKTLQNFEIVGDE